jgi:hypothetical protein
MTQPNTGVINDRWVVETYKGVIHANGAVAVFKSTKLSVVSEAYLLAGAQAGGGSVIASASIISHGISVPDQGSIGATQAATLAPQQFMAGFYDTFGTIAAGTQVTAVFLERGT